MRAHKNLLIEDKGRQYVLQTNCGLLGAKKAMISWPISSAVHTCDSIRSLLALLQRLECAMKKILQYVYMQDNK
jgi:hypothetical protein